MSFIRIGDQLINLSNVEYALPDGNRTMVFFNGSESDFIVVDTDFEIFFDKICDRMGVL